ncbi:Zn-dependent protease [Hymenobacter lutimineralis]|uniref:Zn-dependent protease n=1 Tax=Hymenobacter lutimineralis TaxID=2606448 RepID=A0A5D6VHA7_9BACT|nr:Zn-dependent protease [Hymenobacter lutimineralis]TYZ14482.1 Zn-dependent protease [Hymenobacter lutimineralis]
MSSCGLRPSTRPVLVLQPFRGFPSPLFDSVHRQIQRLYPLVVQRPAAALPRSAYYAPRHRYRADSLLHFLVGRHQPDTVVIGLTQQDISTTKNEVRDWGVMGLGYCPGRACVISSFRLKRRNLSTQFYKVVLHEIGHTQGLPHCTTRTCFMRDAEGGNPTDEETSFCRACTGHLQSRGWKLASQSLVLPKTP